MIKRLFFIAIFLIFMPLTMAIDGKMPLLAVTINENGYIGSTAELFLEIKDGTGRVFVDTFPLSKLDTQISMRFAKESACNFLAIDCDDKDFIYTIRAGSPIVGGPSAGAAATILTISLLDNTPIKEGMAITGTINSGGLIGNVGGLKSKIEAGKGLLTKVLIPEGEEENVTLKDNSTVTLKEFGKTIGIEVIDVSDLYPALEIFTGKSYKSDDKEIKISEFYGKTMKKLAEDLCNRNDKFKELIIGKNLKEETQKLYDEGLNLSEKGRYTFENKEFYAGASYCFGSNVKLQQVYLDENNLSNTRYIELMKELRQKIDDFEGSIDSKKINTITDLESYMIAKERVAEARRYANDTASNNSLQYNYAYSKERLFSAISWAEFFGSPGKVLEFDEQSLKESARQRIGEAEERMQYADLYLPFSLTSPKKELELAYEDFNDKKYALALFKATKAKSEVNIVLNTLGIGLDHIPRLIEKKLEAASRVIVKAESKGIFPILGYSYYEYANNLKKSDPTSGLLYAEYALELSNLDIYFKEKKLKLPKIDYTRLLIFSLGVILGLIIAKIVEIEKRKKQVKKKKKR